MNNEVKPVGDSPGNQQRPSDEAPRQRKPITRWELAAWMAVAAALVAVLFFGWPLLNDDGDDDDDPAAAKQRACAALTNFQAVKQQGTLGYNDAEASRMRAIFDAARAEVRDLFAEAARADNSWARIQEAVYRYTDASSPGNTVVDTEPLTTAKAACDRL